MQSEELDDVKQVRWDHSHPVMQSEDLIEEVRKRPGLWDPMQPADRIDKLNLWKDVGAALFDDWQKLNKAVAYDRVLQIQKKWRSLKDAYNRELRARRRGIRVNRRVYIHFKNLAFLGGFEGLPGPNKRPFEVSDEDAADNDHSDDAKWLDPPDTPDSETIPDPDPLVLKKTKRKPKRKQKYAQKPEEIEMPMFLNEMREQDTDSDKLFLLSFSQELKKLPPSIKMWARAQIANVMQEAVNCHFNKTQPRSSEGPSHVDIKRPRHSSSD